MTTTDHHNFPWLVDRQLCSPEIISLQFKLTMYTALVLTPFIKCYNNKLKVSCLCAQAGGPPLPACIRQAYCLHALDRQAGMFSQEEQATFFRQTSLNSSESLPQQILHTDTKIVSKWFNNWIDLQSQIIFHYFGRHCTRNKS